MAALKEEPWLDTMRAAMRYDVSSDTLRLWRRFHGFPLSAVVREANVCFWDVEQIDQWLRSRPLHKHGRPVRWAQTVNHPMAI